MRVEVFDAVVVALDDFLDGLQVAGRPLLRNAEERLLGAVDDLFDGQLLVVGQPGDVADGVQEAAADGGLFHQPSVGFDADGGGDGVDELRDVGRATDGFELFALLQIRGQREEVDGIAPLVDADDGFVDPAMLLQVEVLRVQEGEHAEDAFRVDQQSAEDGFLGFDVVRVRFYRERSF